MRIYEFSKLHALATKDIIDVLQANGFDVKSHMSLLTEPMLTLLEKSLLKKENEKKAQDAPSQQPPIIAKSEAVTSQTPKTKPEKETMQKDLHTSRIKKSSPTIHKEVQRPEKDVALQQLPQEIVVESMSVGDAALKLHKSVNEVILTLLRSGVVATKNQILSESAVVKLAEAYHIKPVKPVAITQAQPEIKKEVSTVASGNLKERLPIAVVLGHVDHGKTTLLDFIRKTRVASKEKGGITQHLGAYEAKTPHGNVIFLDTPGHEAFSKIRQRGVRVADIAILVVAADDGIMPQTIEAIKQARNMHVPIIVAVNKIDKVDVTRLEGIKRELAQQDLLPEEWGGSTVVAPISAKLGTGVDSLLEMIVLQAQLMELRADFDSPARGYILESKLEKGRGSVATIICQSGKLAMGDYFICGNTTGKISSLVDSYGRPIKDAYPSVPVQISGFNDLPEVGDVFEVVTKEEYLKAKDKQSDIKSVTNRIIKEGSINLIIKTDTNASREALIESIEKLSKRVPTGFNVLFSGVGNISESDIELAYNTGSLIIALHVRTEANASSLAQQRDTTIEQYDIIYKLLEALEARAEGTREIEKVRTKIGEAVVRKVFDIKGIGIVAGSYVKDGRFVKDGSVTVWRGKQKVGDGKIVSLQRDKKVVKEVHAGFECGFIIDGIEDWQPDDRVECFVELPKK